MSKKRSAIKELKSVATRANQLCTSLDDPLPEKSSLRSTTHMARNKGHSVVLGNREVLPVDSQVEVSDVNHAKDPLKYIKEELSVKDIEDLTSIFEIFAMHSSGKLCFMDLQKALRFLNLHPEEDVLKKVIQANNCGSTYMDSFDLNAFLICVVECQSNSRDIYGEIVSGFDKFDIEKKQRINMQNLIYLNRKYNVGLSREELGEMLYEADFNGDRQIEQQEFVKIMRKTNLFQ